MLILAACHSTVVDFCLVGPYYGLLPVVRPLYHCLHSWNSSSWTTNPPPKTFFFWFSDWGPQFILVVEYFAWQWLCVIIFLHNTVLQAEACQCYDLPIWLCVVTPVFIISPSYSGSCHMWFVSTSVLTLLLPDLGHSFFYVPDSCILPGIVGLKRRLLSHQLWALGTPAHFEEPMLRKVICVHYIVFLC